MEGVSEQEVKKLMELMDLNDTTIVSIFKRLSDDDLVNVAYTCKRLQRIIRNFLLQKYQNSLKMSSPNSQEVSLYTWDNIHHPCPLIEVVVRLYPHIEILHLDTYDSWEELIPIAKHLMRLRELDMKISVMGYNHIFYSADRIQRMFCIAFEKKLPIQRLKMEMEFGFIVNMLWMIAENLTQLKELELKFQYEICVGELENDEDSLRFETVEKLAVHCAKNGAEGFAMQSIAMFAYVELKEFTLIGLRAPPKVSIDFILRQNNLQKLKLVDCTDFGAEALCDFKNKLSHLKEIVADVDEQSKELLSKQFNSRWTISEQTETYEEKLIKLWRFQRIES